MVGAVVDAPDSWIDRTADPDRWWQAVNDDRAIVARLHDGAVDLADETGADPAALPACSCSAPGLVHHMLEPLQAHSKHKVLEFDAGWTDEPLTALGTNVVTIEIDAAWPPRHAPTSPPPNCRRQCALETAPTTGSPPPPTTGGASPAA
ncbi:hypothetical protein Arub01_55810 [Actinomadura rubrobrunea]|uniref:Uncharacterized protein n=1 Tax=Actinomadura rubrobrunea TaxID=115335 RepID=A0A9W6UYL4_9ACTN|nr:hypothetical protein [Actinomadura rubrobrunea]GLW67338.1 hypothetical protein Arub01_55810 [Actinomadura rubrobrunea]